MIDLYLKADSENALIEALAIFRSTNEKGEAVWVTASHAHALDVVGTIYTPAVFDDGGAVVEPAEPKPGYHANLRLFGDGEALVSTMQARLIVQPVTPDRVWA